MKFLFFLIAATCGLSDPGSGQEARFQTAIDKAREKTGARGMAAALIRANGDVHVMVAGERQAGEAVTADSVFQIGSVTKTFTATLIVQLIEEGQLSLDDKLSKWFPDLPNAGQIEICQLLNHTSGMHDVFQDSGFVRQLYFGNRQWRAAEVLDKTGPSEFVPGSKWAYSSGGYVALCAIAEKETSQALDQLFCDRLFDPLKLERIYMGGHQEVPPPLAHGFVDINNDGVDEDLSRLVSMKGFLSASGGAGELVATPLSVARFFDGLFDARLVRVEGMQAWVDRPDGNQHGLGLLRTEIDGFELLGHRGNTGGFSCAAWYVPKRDLTIVVCANKSGLTLSDMVSELLKVEQLIR